MLGWDEVNLVVRPIENRREEREDEKDEPAKWRRGFKMGNKTRRWERQNGGKGNKTKPGCIQSPPPIDPKEERREIKR